MEKEIYYIGYYDSNDNINENRQFSLAATNKMNYIFSALNSIGYKVLVISPSRTKNKIFYKGKVTKLNDNTKLKLFLTVPWTHKVLKAFSLVLGDIMLFIYLISHLKKNELVLVYHSLALRNIVSLAKKIKGFKIILEVEEIYSDIVSGSKKSKRNEKNNIAIADKYIFPTELLNQKLNKTNKPYIIVTGTYQVEKRRLGKFDDNKTHVVYAGTFDPRKGGALAAAAAAEYIPENYHLHIIGFGSDIDKKDLLMKIEEISKKTKATVTYDGLLSGEEYISFIQKCQIGLSTQSPEAAYNETSFPSKILSYMANGLRVVSIRIKAIEISEIGNSVYYYEEPKPEEIAKAIMSINLKDSYDSRKIIRQLDKKFRENIKGLLED